MDPGAAASSRNVRFCLRLYARATQAGTTAQAEAGGKDARYAFGDMSYSRVNDVVNEPTLVSPTDMQISATDRSVLRSRAAARSSRRVRR